MQDQDPTIPHVEDYSVVDFSVTYRFSDQSTLEVINQRDDIGTLAIREVALTIGATSSRVPFCDKRELSGDIDSRTFQGYVASAFNYSKWLRFLFDHRSEVGQSANPRAKESPEQTARAQHNYLVLQRWDLDGRRAWAFSGELEVLLDPEHPLEVAEPSANGAASSRNVKN